MAEPGSPPNDIVFYWYRASPYGRRVSWYLTLRKIQHAECLQPPILPRPDQTRLGIQYRRSPLLAIGRDVYADTRLILRRLEEVIPPSAAHPALASSGSSAGLAALLQKFTVDMSVFKHVVRLIPRNLPMMKDARFQKDRSQFMDPNAFRGVDPRLIQPEALVHMRGCFDVIEALLADGREWVAGTATPSMADIEGLWPFDWFITDLQPRSEYFSAQQYPLLHAWRTRFRAALASAQSQNPKPMRISGADAANYVTHARFSDPQPTVDPHDPLRLAPDARVELFPTDGGGFTHKDQGRLVKLTKDEVAIAVTSSDGQEVRLHAPRWEFRVRKLCEEPGKL